ncbi:MAG: DUF4091 domain-containing protein [Lentisphaeria bacterium]|nr:DUF4091 domain-containing protein [Lentisphaeria bacterium]
MAKLPLSIKQGKILQGERFNFQLLFYSGDMHNRKSRVELISNFPGTFSVREVGYTPVTFTGYEPCDKDVLSDMAGIYPDRLMPLKEECTRVVIRQTKTLWISVDAPLDAPPGEYSVKLRFTVHPDDADGEAAAKEPIQYFTTPEFKLQLLPFALPEQRLKVTQWFHPDSLSSCYKVPMWSEKHWLLVENCFRDMSAHGTNMILVPVLSLILNVAEGHRREIAQLVTIRRTEKREYGFDFSRVERYIKLALECGFQYLEISHLFSQWGAAYAPPVIVDGELLFDGMTPGDDPEYRKLLGTLLKELKVLLQKLGVADRTVFHCSDEPPADKIGQYREAMEFLKKHLEGFQIIDALNNADIFSDSGVDTPVPLISQLKFFKNIKLREKWCYYCCAPAHKMPNRFIHFPSSRNRIFGTLLWKYGMEGFLHWGYNFYFEALSRFAVDPFADPGSDRFYPPGDAFLVYPGADGTPEDSIRHEVFAEALQDFRLLDLLSASLGRKKVLQLLSKLCGRLSMSSYPRGEKAVLQLREKLLEALSRS